MGRVGLFCLRIVDVSCDTMRVIVTDHDRNAFVTVEEPKVLRGGLIAPTDWRLGEPFVRWMNGRARA